MSTSETSWLETMPEIYDRHLGPTLFAPYAEHVSALAAALSPQCVLEIAAGTGITTAALIRRLPGAAITATDLNPAMVEWARRAVTGAGWRQADAESLPFADGSFDLVVCQFGVMFFPDRRRAFAEAARVLASDGTFLFTSWDVVQASTLTAALVDSLAAVLHDDAPTFITRVPHGYTEPDQIRQDLEAAGLRPGRVDRVVLSGTTASARFLTEGFCLGTPLRFELEERGPLDRLTAALAEEMTSRLGSGPITGEMAAFVVSAGKPAPAEPS